MCTPLIKANLLSAALIVIILQSNGSQPSPDSLQPARLIGPISVPPEGWRLTADGWEQTDHWAASSSSQAAERLNRLIDLQYQQESATPMGSIITRFLGMLHGIDPITLASAQIAMIAMLLFIARYSQERRKRHDTFARITATPRD